MGKERLDLSWMLPDYETVELPSRGLLYKGVLSSGKINLRPMISSEERLVGKLNEYNYHQIFNTIVEKCSKETFDANDLTSNDRYYILCWLRSQSYGNTYDIEYTCAKCGKSFLSTIDLSVFVPKFLEEIKEPLLITLPISKIELQLIYPRVRQYKEAFEKSYAEEELAKRNKKFAKDISEEDYMKAKCIVKMILPTEDRTILSVENEEDFIDMIRVIENLRPIDKMAIENEFDKYDHGLVDPVVDKCKHCGALYEKYPVPSSQFFRANTESGDLNRNSKESTDNI